VVSVNFLTSPGQPLDTVLSRRVGLLLRMIPVRKAVVQTALRLGGT